MALWQQPYTKGGVCVSFHTGTQCYGWEQTPPRPTLGKACNAGFDSAVTFGCQLAANITIDQVAEVAIGAAAAADDIAVGEAVAIEPAAEVGRAPVCDAV